MTQQIDEVTLAIQEANTALIEYNNEIRSIEWEIFDLIEERISNITTEADFLIDLLESADLYDDKGQFTDEGWATVALHAENMNIDYANAESYYKEMQELQEQIAEDPYNQTLIDRYDELSEKRMEAITDAENEKESIISLVQDGIELEIDAFNDLISEIESAVEAEKSLYDYSIKVQDAVDEIASLNKQITAYSGDDSEESAKTVQQLKSQLATAEQSLESLEYDQYISDLRSLLDDLSSEYETVLNMRLDDVTSLISDLTGYINDNSDTIYQTLIDTSESVGYTLSTEMESIWGSGGTVLTTMSDNIKNGISSASTTINSTLKTINTNISKMISQLNALAKTNVSSATSSSASSSASTSVSSTTSSSSSSSSSSGSSSSSSSSSGWGSWFIYKKDSYPKSKLRVDTSIVDRLKYHDYDSSFSARSGYYKNMGGSGSYTGTDSQNTWMISQMRNHGFQSGGTIGDLISKTGEDGFILARTGEEVLSLKKIEALGEAFAQMNPVLETLTDLNNVLPDFSDVTSNNENSTINNEFKIDFTLPDVTNADEFVNELVTNKKLEQAIQAMTIGRLDGGSSLKKYKYKS